MSERDLWWKIVAVGAVMALAWATFWPPNEKLKYGIDLYGGYSLLYEIDDTGMEGPERERLAENMMRILRERVDPQGVYNLVWRPVGYNRLEIQMPRPSELVRQARTEYEAYQAEVQETHLRRSDVLRALARPLEDRTLALDSLVLNIEPRRSLLAATAAAYDEFQRADAEYQARVEKINAEKLTREELESALARPAAERPAALEALVRGIDSRRALLDEAAKLWDELAAMRPTTQPAPPPPPSTAPASQPSPDALRDFALKQDALAEAVERVLATNVDPRKLTDGVTLDTAIELESKFDAAVSAVLATNVDTNRLQIAMDAKAGDKARVEGLKTLTEQFPGLAELFTRMASAADQLRAKRRGEGRLEDPADLQRLLKGAGVLEFRILAEPDPGGDRYASYVESLKANGPRPRPGEESYQWFEIENAADFLNIRNIANVDAEIEAQKATGRFRAVVERYGDKYFVLSHIGDVYALTRKPGQEDWALEGARPDTDQNGRPCISFTLDERGGSKFHVLTKTNLQRQLCIFLDDLAISHATIQSPIRRHGQITGSFQRQEVVEACKKLNAGSLPRKLKDPPISIRSIGPSLGEANRAAGLRSGQYGAVLVCLFMLFFYFYAGGIAIVAMIMNLLITFAALASMGATLTLPGIAGLVLSVGMAVDANVLINERIREELAKGAVLRMAIKLGYDRAFSAILDSNVTTILTSTILYFLGGEEVKGFGLTLGIGVLANILTAYFVSRMFFEFMSMIRLPVEVKRNPYIAALIIGAFGALIYGLGYWLTDPENRAQSVLLLFGEAIAFCAPAIAALHLFMTAGRAIHAAFQRGGVQRLPMLPTIPRPHIDWAGKRPVFYGLSITLVIVAVGLLATLDRDDLYDIEFLGGTAAQIDLKTPQSLTAEQIADKLQIAGANLKGFGAAVEAGQVAGSAGNWSIKAPGVPAARFEPVIRAVLDKQLAQLSPVEYPDPASESIIVRTRTEDPENKDGRVLDLPAMQAQLKTFGDRFRRAGEAIASAQVQAVSAVGTGAVEGRSFEVVTREQSKEIVVGAIMDQLRDHIETQSRLEFRFVRQGDENSPAWFAIRSERPQDCGLPLSPAELTGVDLHGWKGGVAVLVEGMNPPQSLEDLEKRLRAMRFQPGFEKYGWRETECIGLTTAPGSSLYTKAIVLTADENFPLDETGEPSPTWISELAEPEAAIVQTALERQTSLAQITQFDEQVSGEAKTNAIIALVLSWVGITLYLWFRFGNFRWGMAAVVALVHDLLIVCLFLALSHLIAETALGKALLIDRFRIDLAMVAALLTIIGYSVNDTIVVYDRIRENKGRVRDVTPTMVNDSVNQTLSRTLLTGLTTMFTVTIMYVLGGQGIHGFNYALLIGILTGTYSSFGIAGQMLIRRAARARA